MLKRAFVNNIITRNFSSVSKYSEKFFQSNNIWGIMTSIDVRKCDPVKIRDPKVIEDYVVQLCKLIDMKRFGPCTVVNFGENEKVAGYSMFQLIETSCISGHFANLTNTSYIDIFSCKYYDPDIALKFTANYFGSTNYTYNVLLRK